MLKIYNTLTRQLEEFTPIETGKVRFYQCGPTVYWIQHIGNLRAMTMGDLMRRSLLYLGYDVNYVLNYTDVGHLTSDEDEGEDKITKGAKREGLSPEQIAEKYIKLFENDTQSLNILPPTHRPKATEYVEHMIGMVKILLEKGYAYTTDKAIYFNITQFKDYNKLNRQKLELNIQGAGSGNVSDPNKKNLEDFALWFFKTGVHKNALQFWKSPFNSPEVIDGEGFPGWHIECSAMSKNLLGDTLDIHMGGIEHIPIHHTNEIAQSEAANGVKFVNYWVHNEHLMVNDEKMAKSAGTSYVLSDIVDKGFPPLVLRYFFLSAHYRSKQNFTWEALASAQIAYEKLLRKIVELRAEMKNQPSGSMAIDANFKKMFQEALDKDFNLSQALAVTWDLIKSELNSSVQLATLLDFDRVLGLDLEQAEDLMHQEIIIPEKAKLMLEERAEARKNKDWATSDLLRKELELEFGIKVEDTKEGQKVS